MGQTQWAVGVDIGGTRLSVARVSDCGQVDCLQRLSTPREAGADAALEQLLGALPEVLDSQARPVGIGIGFGGPVDAQAGLIRFSHHVEGWAGIDILSVFRERTGLPVFLENDANAGGLAEALFGSGQGFETVLYVNIGTGVGGAVIIDGAIHRGHNGNAGEFGHIVLDPGGPVCTCDKRGCVEALCSGDAIGRMAREADLTGSSLSGIAPEERTGAMVGELAAAGDPVCAGILAQSAEYMGLAIAGAVNLMDPGVVVIGGGVSELGETYLSPVRSSFTRYATGVAAGGTAILAARLGYNAGVIGAGALCLTQIDDQSSGG